MRKTLPWYASFLFFSLLIISCIGNGQACKPFERAFQAKTIFSRNLQQDLYSLGLPVPDYCKPLGVLPGLQHKLLTEHAVGLNQNLELKRTPTLFPLHDMGSITWARILYGRWLLAAVSDRTNSVLKLWPLSAFADPSQPVTSHILAYLHGPVCSGQVEIQKGEIIIALELATAAYVLNLVTKYRMFTRNTLDFRLLRC